MDILALNLICLLAGAFISFAIFKEESLFEKLFYSEFIGIILPTATYFFIWLFFNVRFALSSWLEINIFYMVVGIVLLVAEPIAIKIKSIPKVLPEKKINVI